jgi:hypothetical protein
MGDVRRASKPNLLTDVVFVGHRFPLGEDETHNPIRAAPQLRRGPTWKRTKPPAVRAAPDSSPDAAWAPCCAVPSHAVWMLLTATLPERRSSAVSKETF